ncbi:uncharacterized protein VDAG_04206 [Verticillium dahliae VdLs.17]|uniref:GRF-type domain-containing protein n=1 Tax=Verticillium dahliae (strain VdLs.17 / ATCC MYA-4575 / FGSC 10137) TaxID=498257 RepID=G2X312_VERDV|nr:uncharacterized protein VDAG_04206 [Verticillium dahliae VdLs.17]EGY22768.1 hypothetical protein VDAG_04206 [Verticillium dahliae VdLs.17]KAH6700446.1 hypothetical protein EV126DRAFT_341104 [Verticillium dahliae]
MPYNKTPRSSRARGRLMQNDHTPSKAPSSSARPYTSSRKQRLSGLYADGLWYCNCEPRCEAKQYPVKKKGPNKGKLFWTCVLRACDFFLWDDDATARTLGLAVTTIEDPVPQTQPSPAAPNETAKAAVRAAIDISSEEDNVVRMPAGPAASKQAPLTANKRKRNQVNEEEDLIGDLSSDEERQLNDAVTRSSQKLRDNNLQAQSFLTPATERTTDLLNGMPTPATARILFPGPSLKRLKTSNDDLDTMSPGLETPQQTPATSRTRDALQSSPATHGDADVEITEAVMALLRDQHLPPALTLSLRNTLDRHAARTRGLIKGRDAVRGQLKAKDERAAQLQERIVALENKNKAMRASLTDMKAGLQNLYAQH